MADIRSGGAFVEVTAKDSTSTGLKAVEKNLKALSTTAAKSGRDISAGLSLAFSGIKTGDLAKLSSAGGLIGRGLTDGFKGVMTAFPAIVKGSIQTAIPAAKSAGLLLAAAAVAGVAVLKNSFESLDVLGKTADRIGISTQALQALQHAASLAGVDSDTLTKSLTKLQVGLTNAAQGGGPIKSFEALKLDAAELQKLPLDEAMGKIADALAQVSNPAERAALAIDIFGKSGAELIPLLSEGSAGMKDAAKEAAALGKNLSRLDVAQVEAANDAVDKMKSAFGGLVDKLAVELAPSILAAANAITEFVSQSKVMDVVLPIIEAIVKAMMIVRSAYTGAQAIVAFAIGGIVLAMSDWGKSIAEVLNLIPGVEVKFGDSLRNLGNDLVDESERLAKKSGKEFAAAMDFKLPVPTATIKVKTQGSAETVAELLAAAEAAKNLQQVMKDAEKSMADFSMSELDKSLAETSKKYDDLIAKVKEAADKTQDAALKAAAAEQVRQIEVAKGIAIEKTRADFLAKAAAEELARQETFNKTIKEARQAVGNLTPKNPVDAAVDEATAKYQGIIDKLAEAGSKAAADAAAATDAAAKESSMARQLAIMEEISAVRAAEVEGIARAREAGGIAAEEIRRNVANIQAEVADAQKAVERASGVGGIAKNIGGFDAAALARSSLQAYNDPQLTEAKKANKQLQDANFELKKLNQKEGAIFA